MNTEELQTLTYRAEESAPEIVDRIRYCLDRIADENVNLDQAIEMMGAVLVNWLIGLDLHPEDPSFTCVAVWLGDEFCEKVLGTKPFMRSKLAELEADTFGSKRTRRRVDPRILASHQFLAPIRCIGGKQKRANTRESVQ
ncbi:MAG: hypothetical protein O2856_12625 [Planctomycetota bacterium]|nr:hypothetical protein [Planctomycetota bacterium]